jgi:hypothetical protein
VGREILEKKSDFHPRMLSFLLKSGPFSRVFHANSLVDPLGGPLSRIEGGPHLTWQGSSEEKIAFRNVGSAKWDEVRRVSLL